MGSRAQLTTSIRAWLALFILGLVLSGITAFPLVHETGFLVKAAHSLDMDHHAPLLLRWLERVHAALVETGLHYPFLAYGTDWLAFGHLVIAMAFIGPWKDPVRNQWVVTFGLLACFGVLPLAFIAGPVRGIPIYWRCIDASFGVFGSIPLWIVRSHTRALEQIGASSPTRNILSGQGLLHQYAAAEDAAKE